MTTTIATFKGYILNDQFFRTKEEALRKVQGILYAYPVGARVSDSDARFLLDLLQNHPEASRKIGCGIESFEVRMNPRFTTKRCFYLIRIDNSQDDFSFMKCFYPPSSIAIFKAICRRLIGRQLYWFKANYFREHQRADGCVQCPVTGQWITQDQAHVDHVPPATFEQIVTNFITQNTIALQDVEIREAEGEAEIGKTFASESLAENWIRYHDLNAKLRVVSAYANLSIIKRSSSTRNEQRSA